MKVELELLALTIIASWTIFVSLMFAPMLVIATLHFISMVIKKQK